MFIEIMELIFILILAIFIDICFGEISNKFHPIAWLGKLIFLEIKLSEYKSSTFQFWYGVIIVVFTTTFISLLAYFTFNFLSAINQLVYIIFSGLIFKFTFSLRGLLKAANSIKISLVENKLNESRSNLIALVSRNVDQLDKEQVISATVESLAENICDSFIAPLFYFLLLGIPGAIAYRIVNTFDAMIGYHGKWEYTGKFAAKFDDIINYIPARISAVLIVISSAICQKNVAQSWYIMIRDNQKTESPNAGWTMSAAAGALDIQLIKIGYYQLGNPTHKLTTNNIEEISLLIIVVAVLGTLSTIFIRGIIFVTA